MILKNEENKYWDGKEWVELSECVVFNDSDRGAILDSMKSGCSDVYRLSGGKADERSRISMRRMRDRRKKNGIRERAIYMTDDEYRWALDELKKRREAPAKKQEILDAIQIVRKISE